MPRSRTRSSCVWSAWWTRSRRTAGSNAAPRGVLPTRTPVRRTRFPVKKRVEPPAPAGSALDARAQAQTTFASVENAGASAFAVSVLKQKIWVDCVSYELQEIFGIEHCSTGTPANADGADDDGESGKECVICMTEPRDTTARPAATCACARVRAHAPGAEQQVPHLQDAGGEPAGNKGGLQGRRVTPFEYVYINHDGCFRL